MVHVPAGSFVMGSPDGSGATDEHPQHKVTLSGYCIDTTEVTVLAWAKCAALGSCPLAPTTYRTDAEPDGKPGANCNGNRDDRQTHPINCVDWNQAKTYCEWANKRLPTEAEWEYAAKGSDGRAYPWGNDAPSAKRLNACGGECAKKLYADSDGFKATAPVGSFPDGASPFGALDMAGNVWEWTADGYGKYSADAVTNPTGNPDGKARVFRGGGWDNADAKDVRATARHSHTPEWRLTNLGFRCARSE
jgi:formylglycine-generating enzyme required for sulfatase activity